MKYKELVSAGKSLKKHVNISYKSTIEEKFPVDINNHTFRLNKKEIQRLEETINMTTTVLIRKYELGLYL